MLWNEMTLPKADSARRTKEYMIKQIKRLLALAIVKSDGKPTAFAKRFGIKRFADFYAVFKEMKKLFKTDRESVAFEIIIMLAQSVTGRVTKGDPTKEFMAWTWVLRTVGYVMDDLRLLKKAIEELEKEVEQG